MNRRPKLTPIQEDTLVFMNQYKAENESPPSIRDIGKHFQISPNAVFCRIQALVKKRYVKRNEIGKYIPVD